MEQLQDKQSLLKEYESRIRLIRRVIDKDRAAGGRDLKVKQWIFTLMQALHEKGNIHYCFYCLSPKNQNEYNLA